MNDASLDALQVVVDELKSADDSSAVIDARHAFYERLFELADRPRAMAISNQLRSAVGQLPAPAAGQRGARAPGVPRPAPPEGPGRRVDWLRNHLARVSARLQQLVADSDNAEQA